MAGAGSRFLKLAGMTASIATKAVTTSVKSRNATDEEKQAARSALYTEVGVQIAETLGQMKGAVMKVGQMVSQYQDLFPPEIAQAVAKLQRAAPPMPFAQIKQQVERELKRPLTEVFEHFEETAFASASIGQVHRATLKDGRRVVVKVQYPGVEENCESDLKQVRLALKLMGLMKVDKASQDALFAEMRDSLYDELDYTKEAHNLQVFKTFHATLDPKIIIPTVYPEFSSRRVLTLSEEQGESIETASTWPLEVRNELGERLINFIAHEMYILNSFHCDPHPGNFAFRADGSLVVYDFGATKELTPETAKAMRDLFSAARRRDILTLEQHLRQLGVRTQDGEVPAAFYQKWIDLTIPPLTSRYDFASGEVHKRIPGLVRDSWPYADAFKPSSQTMMSNRAVSGHYWNLVALKVDTDFTPQIDQIFGAVA